MTFLLIFNMLSQTHTHTHSHIMYNVTDRFTFPFCPKTNWFFPLSPKWNARVWVLVLAWACVCMSLYVSAPVPQRIDSIEFSDWKWKLCRSCIMFCLLVCTWTQTDGRGRASVRDWWCARIWYECESFLAQSKLFLYQNLCVLCREEPVFFSLSTRKARKTSESELSDISLLACYARKKKEISEKRNRWCVYFVANTFEWILDDCVHQLFWIFEKKSVQFDSEFRWIHLNTFNMKLWKMNWPNSHV